MKRVIVGLGVGVYILLFWVTPVPAFDRDINLPSQNVSDPISIYSPSGDDGGWEELQKTSLPPSKIDISSVFDSFVATHPVVGFSIRYVIAKFRNISAEGLVSDGESVDKQDFTASQSTFTE